MDFNVLTTGINACVVLATTMTGLVIGTPVSFSWNGVKVTVGNSGEEQSKTEEKQEGMDDEENRGHVGKTMEENEAYDIPGNTPHNIKREETEKVLIKNKKKKLKKIRKMLNWIRRRKSMF